MTKVDEATILQFFRDRQARKTIPLNISLSDMTLTNASLGIGDTLILTALSRVSVRDPVQTSIHSFSPHFTQLMRFNPGYTPSIKPFWVSACHLCYTFDLGNGHFSQRLQRAFGFVPDIVPGGYVV